MANIIDAGRDALNGKRRDVQNSSLFEKQKRTPGLSLETLAHTKKREPYDSLFFNQTSLLRHASLVK